MASFGSLFGGWSKLQEVKPEPKPKTHNMKVLFRPLKDDGQKKNKIVACYDASGSTSFHDRTSHDGKTFAQIYAEALSYIHGMLKDHTNGIIAWSNEARVLSESEKTIFENCLESHIAFSKEIVGMDMGTNPISCFPLIIGTTAVVVTDGDIMDQQITNMKSMIATSGIGAVVLIIVPHINTYPNMYNNAPIEMNSKDNIKLSIPQAFSQKLVSVLVWDYKKKTLEIIKELTTPWVTVDETTTLETLVKSKLPNVGPNQLLVKNDKEEYFVVNLPALIDYMNNNPIDEDTLSYLVSNNVAASIRQQGTSVDKTQWNACIRKIYHDMLSAKVATEFQEKVPPTDATIVERIQFSVLAQKQKKIAEGKFRRVLEELCQPLLIDKVVGEISNIAQAKVAQTASNVNQFQTMKQEDKLSSIETVLPIDDCTICGERKHVFSTITFPSTLLLQMGMCTETKTVPAKRGKTRMVTSFNLSIFKHALQNYKPTLYFMKCCPFCANQCMTDAKHQNDPEYGISKVVPQNIVFENGREVLKDIVMLMPFIDSTKMNPALPNPNAPELSFSRQVIRGFISKYLKTGPASQETMIGAIILESALPHDKPSAEMIFANIISLLRGGSVDRYNNTIGRLFRETFDKISTETLTLIATVENVVELAQIPVNPQSNKLLLLCMFNQKVSSLVNAKNQKQKATLKVDAAIQMVLNGTSVPVTHQITFTELDTNKIKECGNFEKFVQEFENDYQRYIATYLQNVANLNIDNVAANEAVLIRIMQATHVNDIAQALYLNTDYLQNLITKAGMTNEQFLAMVPQYITDMAHQDGDINVLLKYIQNE